MDPAPGIDQPGPWVGHYTTAAIAFQHIIPTGKLRMSPYRAMRDPVENKLLIPGTAGFGSADELERGWAAAVGLLKDRWERVRIMSLTHDVTSYAGTTLRFGCCWARSRMWEQYADDHRGVCLVFERQQFEQKLDTDLAEHVASSEVEYTPGGIALSEANLLLDPAILRDDKREQAVLDHLEKHQKELFFLKTDDWRSEHEFRAVLSDVSDDYAFASYGDALRAVVIGEEFPEWQVAGAQALAEQHGLELKRARWDQARPWLVTAT
jgi:hypothetical protein